MLKKLFKKIKKIVYEWFIEPWMEVMLDKRFNDCIVIGSGVTVGALGTIGLFGLGASLMNILFKLPKIILRIVIFIVKKYAGI